jgi:hypothetical protein
MRQQQLHSCWLSIWMGCLEVVGNCQMAIVAFHNLNCSINYMVNACFARFGTGDARLGKILSNRRSDQRAHDLGASARR